MFSCTAILGVTDVPESPDGASNDGAPATSDALDARPSGAETSTDAYVDAGVCLACAGLTASNLDQACAGSKNLYLNFIGCRCLAVPERGQVGSGACEDAGDAAGCNPFCASPDTVAFAVEDTHCASCVGSHCESAAAMCAGDGVDAGPGDGG